MLVLVTFSTSREAATGGTAAVEAAGEASCCHAMYQVPGNDVMHAMRRTRVE